MEIQTYIFLAIAGFFAGFLDAIVGGGGLILTPAMVNLFPNFEILRVIATNRTSSILGTSIAAWNYFQHIKISPKVIIFACVSALFMSTIGAYLASFIPPNILKIIVLFTIVAIAFYSFFQKTFGQEENLRYSEEMLPKAAALVGGLCGFYNGLIGPGTGTILVFAFVSLIGMNFLRASGISKIVNVSGDIGSWTILMSKGFVFWEAAIPLVIFNVIGSYFGSKMAILKGNLFIKLVFNFVVMVLILKILYDVFRS